MKCQPLETVDNNCVYFSWFKLALQQPLKNLAVGLQITLCTEFAFIQDVLLCPVHDVRKLNTHSGNCVCLYFTSKTTGQILMRFYIGGPYKNL
jgi:hypothetical protein